MSMVGRCAKMFSWIPNTVATVREYVNKRIRGLDGKVVRVSSSSTLPREQHVDAPRILDINLSKEARRDIEPTKRKYLPSVADPVETATETPERSADALADSSARLESMLNEMDAHPENYALPAKIAYDVTAYDASVADFIAQKLAKKKPMPLPRTPSPVREQKVITEITGAVGGRSSPPVPPKPLKLKLLKPVLSAESERGAHSPGISEGETSPSVKEMRSFFEQKIKENEPLQRPSSPMREKQSMDARTAGDIAA